VAFYERPEGLARGAIRFVGHPDVLEAGQPRARREDPLEELLLGDHALGRGMLEHEAQLLGLLDHEIDRNGDGAQSGEGEIGDDEAQAVAVDDGHAVARPDPARAESRGGLQDFLAEPGIGDLSLPVAFGFLGRED
jgi:hypothetical protein